MFTESGQLVSHANTRGLQKENFEKFFKNCIPAKFFIQNGKIFLWFMLLNPTGTWESSSRTLLKSTSAWIPAQANQGSLEEWGRGHRRAAFFFLKACSIFCCITSHPRNEAAYFLSGSQIHTLGRVWQAQLCIVYSISWEGSAWRGRLRDHSLPKLVSGWGLSARCPAGGEGRGLELLSEGLPRLPHGEVTGF